MIRASASEICRALARGASSKLPARGRHTRRGSEFLKTTSSVPGLLQNNVPKRACPASEHPVTSSCQRCIACQPRAGSKRNPGFGTLVHNCDPSLLALCLQSLPLAFPTRSKPYSVEALAWQSPREPRAQRTAQSPANTSLG